MSKQLSVPDQPVVIANYGQDSPCLANIPRVPTQQEAFSALASVGMPARRSNASPRQIEDLKYVFIPTAQHARILIEIIEQMRESYSCRNLLDDDFRHYTFRANQFLNRGFDVHGLRSPLVLGKAPRSKSRGIFICAPLGMGRNLFVDRIESLIGRGKLKIQVRVGGHVIDFFQLKTLRVNWPLNGSRYTFSRSFLAAFDAEMHTEYSRRTRGAGARKDDMIDAICALAVASNLGLLIVECINYRQATGRNSEGMWEALGQFTRVTGIPVLCLATPGAAIGLARSSAIGDLTPRGIRNIPIPEKNSPTWLASSNAYFKCISANIGLKSKPSWFDSILWDLSEGRHGTAAKACAIVATHFNTSKSHEINAEVFVKLAQLGMPLDEVNLRAVRLAKNGGTFSTSSLLRYGDWLTLEIMLNTILGLELVNKPIQIS